MVLHLTFCVRYSTYTERKLCTAHLKHHVDVIAVGQQADTCLARVGVCVQYEIDDERLDELKVRALDAARPIDNHHQVWVDAAVCNRLGDAITPAHDVIALFIRISAHIQ